MHATLWGGVCGLVCGLPPVPIDSNQCLSLEAEDPESRDGRGREGGKMMEESVFSLRGDGRERTEHDETDDDDDDDGGDSDDDDDGNTEKYSIGGGGEPTAEPS